MRIAILAGEASGDILGAGLVCALKQRFSDHYPGEELHFEGIAGPLMQAEGVQSLFAMDRLSVMGLVEVLGRLRELLGIRKQLRQRWISNPPDLFIGIDAPDFNLGLEESLRQAGIPTVHYVSPSIWAWRQGRVKKIARSTDLMLCLLPFEKAFYDKADVDARFVGHTLADQLPIEPDVCAARATLELADGERYLALLPGSRSGEVKRLGPIFLDTAAWLLERQPDLKFLLPAANEARYQQISELLEGRNLPVRVLQGQSREAMVASEAVLMASGTAALEGMLTKRPLVVSYQASALSYAIIKPMLKVPYVSLPNLLADEMLVPELLQKNATPQKLGQALLDQLADPQKQVQRFTELHQQLRCNASEQAALAVFELIARKRADNE
ncbi:MAG: lipid-A-disaccharide synthase [Motiliproteus sp.]